MNVAVDSETLTVGATAIALTAAKTAVPTVTFVTVYAEGDVRFWTSGKSPTATEGIPLYAENERTFSRVEAEQLRLIRNGAVDVNVHVQYIRVF